MIRKGDPMNNTSKLIALTFDDGPAPTTLPIIQTLEANNSVATFFANGVHLERYPEITAYASQIGCEIGNHTSDHRHLPELSYDEIVKQLEATTDLILPITSLRPTLMRPPFGEYNEDVKQACKACDLALINWSIDPKDWDHDNPDITRERVLNELEDGSIVLFHDRLPGTSALMSRFIPELIELGYKLVTVSQLFEARGLAPNPGTLYLGPIT